MTSLYNCDIDGRCLSGSILDVVAARFSKLYDKSWGRLTVWRSDLVWTDGDNFHSKIPKSKKEFWGHYKKVKIGEKWKLKRISTREFDHLKVSKMREICQRFSIGLSLSNPCKEEILNILDDHTDEVNEYLKCEETSKHLGTFHLSWESKKKKVMVLSQSEHSVTIPIKVAKEGIVDVLFDYRKRIEDLEATNNELASIIVDIETRSEKEKGELLDEIKRLKDINDKLSTSFAESEKINDDLRLKLSEVESSNTKDEDGEPTTYILLDHTDLELY